MSPDPLPCTNTNMCEFFDGLFHHPVMKKKTPGMGNGRTKIHAKLLCQIDR